MTKFFLSTLFLVLTSIPLFASAQDSDNFDRSNLYCKRYGNIVCAVDPRNQACIKKWDEHHDGAPMWRCERYIRTGIGVEDPSIYY